MDASRFNNTKALPPERLRAIRKVKLALKWVLASIFVISGGYHFWRVGFDPEFDLWVLPWPYALIYLSGGLELMLGFMLFFRVMQIIAAWTLILLLIAVAPAHIYFVINSDWDLDTGTLFVWARLVFHFLLIAWTFWYTRSSRRISGSSAAVASAVKTSAPRAAPATAAVPPATAAVPPATAEVPPATAEVPPATAAVPDTANAQEKDRRAGDRRSKDRRSRS